MLQPREIASAWDEIVETILFLLILGSVNMVVLYLVRQRDAAPTPVHVMPSVVVEQPAAPAPAPVAPMETPTHLAVELAPREPPSVEVKVMLPTPTPPVEATVEAPIPRRARKTAALPKEPRQAAPSNVAMVLSMLKERDSLAAAFVLREIFDAPVSRRRR